MERNEDIESTLTRLLERPIQDEDKVLEIVVNAITSKYTDPQMIRQAVKQALLNYENQLRVFMVAVANRQLARILRLIRTIDQIEMEFEKPEMIEQMGAKDLIKVYALQQANLTNSLDYVKKVADMRIEMAVATAAVTNTLTTRESEELNALSSLPKLSPQQRGNVRRIVEGIVSDISLDTEKQEENLRKSDLPPGKSNGDRTKHAVEGESE